jgi:hypothetical protein
MLSESLSPDKPPLDTNKQNLTHIHPTKSGNKKGVA